MYIAERSFYNCVHRILCKYFLSFKVATVFPPKSQPHLTMKCLDFFPLEFVLVHCMRLTSNELKKLKLRLRFNRNTYITERKYRTNPKKKNVKLTDWGKGWIPWISHFCFRFVCFFFLSPWNFAILYTLKMLTNVKATHHRLNYTDETVMVK